MQALPASAQIAESEGRVTSGGDSHRFRCERSANGPSKKLWKATKSVGIYAFTFPRSVQDTDSCSTTRFFVGIRNRLLLVHRRENSSTFPTPA